jgi:hypothetical protein
MNPALYRGTQVEPGRVALGARVERDPFDLSVLERTGSNQTRLGKDLLEDVARLMAPRAPAVAKAARGAGAAAPPVPPAALPYSSLKKYGGERVVPNPVWVH